MIYYSWDEDEGNRYMSVLSVSNVKKEFNDIVILENVSFDIYSGQHVGIVGKNGSGKTTLLNLISGRYECDEGNIHIPSHIRVGVLDQMPSYPDSMTVEDVLRTSFFETENLKKRMKELEKKMAEGDEAAIREYGEASSAFEALGGYTVDVELNRVCNGLDIDKQMLSKSINVLSGGQRTRVNLGRMILLEVDLMLLDEPTNHLDVQSVEWLEEYLREYKGTVLMVSHDRYFLDKTVTRIIEIENLTSKVWEGNYSAYMQQKEHQIKSDEARIRQSERKIAQLESTARRLHDMNMEKLHRRAFAMEKRIERIRAEMPTVVKRERKLKAEFEETRRSGEDVLTIKNLKKAYSENLLFSDVDLELKKDDRVAILGANGTGKTTLLRILLGIETADEGRVRWGSGVKTAYLPQIVEFKNPYMTVLEYVVDELNISISSARNWLGGFHFRGDEVYKCVRDLSGGEKSRLRLCSLMHRGTNMLILDEPTNHLDIQSAEWIEEAILQFKGTLLVVSHDRFFVNKIVDKIWSIENRAIEEFNGGYEEYRAAIAARAGPSPSTEDDNAHTRSQTAKEKADNVNGDRTYRTRSRHSQAMRRQIPILERDIESLESKLEELDSQIELFASDHLRLTELIESRGEVEEELGLLLDKWEQIMREFENDYS